MIVVEPGTKRAIGTLSLSDIFNFLLDPSTRKPRLSETTVRRTLIDFYKILSLVFFVVSQPRICTDGRSTVSELFSCVLKPFCVVGLFNS